MRRALASLFWRMFAPSLADAWDAGYKACIDDNGVADPNFERLTPYNPYRRRG